MNPITNFHPIPSHRPLIKPYTTESYNPPYTHYLPMSIMTDEESNEEGRDGGEGNIGGEEGWEKNGLGKGEVFCVRVGPPPLHSRYAPPFVHLYKNTNQPLHPHAFRSLALFSDPPQPHPVPWWVVTSPPKHTCSSTLPLPPFWSTLQPC